MLSPCQTVLSTRGKFQTGVGWSGEYRLVRALQRSLGICMSVSGSIQLQCQHYFLLIRTLLQGPNKQQSQSLPMASRYLGLLIGTSPHAPLVLPGCWCPVSEEPPKPPPKPSPEPCGCCCCCCCPPTCCPDPPCPAPPCPPWECPGEQGAVHAVCGDYYPANLYSFCTSPLACCHDMFPCCHYKRKVGTHRHARRGKY